MILGAIASKVPVLMSFAFLVDLMVLQMIVNYKMQPEIVKIIEFF